MRAALKARQELKRDEPEGHNDDCNPCYDAKYCSIPARAENPAIEEYRAEFYTSQRVGRDDVSSNFRLYQC